MAKYFVRVKPQFTGYNAVHKENCPFLDGTARKIYLGEFSSSDDAVTEAQRFFLFSKGCSYCMQTRVMEINKFVMEWNMVSFS